jgi:type I restriction enzyme M protein
MITEERIQTMIDNNDLKNFYDEEKMEEYKLMDPIPSKEKKNLNKFLANQPIFEEIIEILKQNSDSEKFDEPKLFVRKLHRVFESTVFFPSEKNSSQNTKKNDLIKKIAHSLSRIDKSAIIQSNSKGEPLVDPATKDVELIPYNKLVEHYMKEEVTPNVPDAIEIFEEDLTKKEKGKLKPSIKIGAEIPFTRYFYKYQAPRPSEVLLEEFQTLDNKLRALLAELR